MPILKGIDHDSQRVRFPMTECTCYLCLRRLGDVDDNGILAVVCPRCKTMSDFDLVAIMDRTGVQAQQGKTG